MDTRLEMLCALTFAILVVLMVACGSDDSVRAALPRNTNPSQPEVAPEDDTARTSFREAKGINQSEALDSDPHFIPPYWLSIQPTRMFIIAASGTAGPKTGTLIIKNRGTKRVRLRSISVEGGESETGSASFDITRLPGNDSLGPGESTAFEVSFYPTTSLIVSGTIHVLTDMPSNPNRSVPITAKSFR